MIKRIIFDLDNTLIMWRDSYRTAIKNTVESYDIGIDYLLIDKVIEEYENYYNYYSKQNMVDLINKKFNLNVGLDFVDSWLEGLKDMADLEEGLIDTLDYLSKKYELVVLTNWFRDSQFGRLQKIGIDKYFKFVYGGEESIKPNPKSYEKAIGNYSKEECIMIGDNYNVDIKGALDFGMKAIMITNKDIEYDGNYKIIHKISELKEML